MAEGFAEIMGAKVEAMTKSWEGASFKRTTKLGLTLDIDVKVPRDVLGVLKKSITDDLAVALSRSAPAVAQALTDAMDSQVWSWSGETLRQSGEVAGDPRDIIDMGALADSLAIEVQGLVMFVSYNTPYAAIIHYGGVTRNGGIIQARPWAEATLFGGGPVEPINWKELLSMGSS